MKVTSILPMVIILAMSSCAKIPLSKNSEKIQLCKVDNSPKLFKKGEIPHDHEERIDKVRHIVKTLPKGSSTLDLNNLLDDSRRHITSHHTLLKAVWTVNGDIYVECAHGVNDKIIDGCVMVYGYNYVEELPANYYTLKDGTLSFPNFN